MVSSCCFGTIYFLSLFGRYFLSSLSLLSLLSLFSLLVSSQGWCLPAVLEQSIFCLCLEGIFFLLSLFSLSLSHLKDGVFLLFSEGFFLFFSLLFSSLLFPCLFSKMVSSYCFGTIYFYLCLEVFFLFSSFSLLL